MSLISPTRVLHDQFIEQRRVKKLEFVWLLPAVLVSGFTFGRGIELQNAALMLTATSILTGLTFSMSTTFWGKAIDARHDPKRALDPLVLDVLDRNLNHLLWTVGVGVLATGVLAVTALFSGVGGVPPLVTAVVALLVVYLVTLVGVALQRFAEAALLLR